MTSVRPSRGRPFRRSSPSVGRSPLTLGLTAFAIEVVLGIGLGILVATRKGGVLDRLSLGTTLVVISIPVFVLGFVVQYVFGVKLGWFPPAGIADGWPTSYILPAFVLASLSLAYVLRLTRYKSAGDLRR